MDATTTFLPGDGEPGLVSIVLPTFNRAYILGAAIESALAQSYPNLEILVVDDGSRDDTAAVVRAFDDSRVRYLHQANAGCPAARNLALRHARGEFIALLDSDDRWLPRKLELQVALLRRFPEVGMVWTDMTAVDDAGAVREARHLRSMYAAYRTVRIEEVLTKVACVGDLLPDAEEEVAGCPIYAGELFSELIVGSMVHTPTVLLRRARARATGGFDETLRPAGEDYDFHLRTAFHGPVALIDTPTMLYRVGNEDQITAPHLSLAMARADLRTVTRWVERGRDRLKLSQGFLERRLAKAHGWIGFAAFESGTMSEARRHLFHSLRLGGWHSRTVLILVATLVPVLLLDLARHLKRRLR